MKKIKHFELLMVIVYLTSFCYEITIKFRIGKNYWKFKIQNSKELIKFRIKNFQNSNSKGKQIRILNVFVYLAVGWLQRN